MSFAYYQGQESQALDYYKKVLAAETNPETRKELDVLVRSLEKIVATEKPQVSQRESAIQNAVAAW
mgnify:CR=1 FL=1